MKCFLKNKFFYFTKAILFFLIISIEINCFSSKLKSLKKINNLSDVKLTDFDKFRFQSSNNQPPPTPEESNDVVFNSQILNKKPPADPDDFETEVFAESASSGTYYKFGLFNFLTFVSYEARNALANGHRYWLSERNVKKDFWEATFCMPQKLDVIQIIWRLPPKSFRIYYKLDMNGDFIPATDVKIKSQAVNAEGNKSESVSKEDAILFNKPIIARIVRIAMNEPLEKHSFSLLKVRFYVNQSTIIIKNPLVSSCQNLCFYVNTDKPRIDSLVEAYNCVDAISTGNNNELFVYTVDRAIIHVNSKYCVGFSQAGELVLKYCSKNKPAYTVQYHTDSSLFFDGYNQDCIYVDDTKKTSANYINLDTDIIVSSQADETTYKKENIKFDGENYWNSAPGQMKVTMQIAFGRIQDKGNYQGQYENKKIDLIKIEWIKEPKKFMVFTWKPGYSWILRQTYENYESKVSEISMIGQEASAIMLILEESHDYKELNMKAAYAIKSVYIGYRGMKVKTIKCNAKTNKYKVFDFDQQQYKTNEYSQKFQSDLKKISQTFEKEINIYKQLKLNLKYAIKHKQKATEFSNKLAEVKQSVGPEAIKKLQEFKNNSLVKINNSKFQDFLTVKEEGQSFKNSISQKIGGRPSSGTISSPANDCLQLKKLKPNSLSGFYYIKPECSPKPLRVFCDFTVYGDAVDIFIDNDDSDHPNPDLSYLNINDYASIRYRCAKLGLTPIQLYNKQMTQRIYDLLSAIGYDLSKPFGVPLGYDYSCKSQKCSKTIFSLNDSLSAPIITFFTQSNSSPTKPGPFYGFGFSKEKYNLISFDKTTPMSAFICSTNHFKSDISDQNIKNISCELNIANNGSIFKLNSSVVVNCPGGCSESMVPVFGSGIYHGASSICKAAIHSNVLLPNGGKVIVKTHKAAKSYIGNTSNGVKSEDFKLNDGNNSFSIIKYQISCPIDNLSNLNEEDKKINEAINQSFIEMNSAIDMSKIDTSEFEGVDIDELKNYGINFIKDNPLNKEFDEYVNNSSINPEQFKFSEMNNLQDTPSTLNNMNSMLDNSVNNAKDILNSVDNQGKNLKNKLLNNANQAMSNISNQFSNFNKNTNINNPITNTPFTNTPIPNIPIPNVPLTEAEKQMNNMLANKLKKDKENLEKSEAKKDIEEKLNTPPGGVPSVPDSSPNGSPREPDVSPEKEETKIEDNGKCSPTTDDANSEIKQIRTASDWDWLTSVKLKSEKIKGLIELFKKNMAWAIEGSKDSNSYLKVQYSLLLNFKSKVEDKVNLLTDSAIARIDKTKKLSETWNEQLEKFTSQDSLSVDYSKSDEWLLKEIFQIWDMKSEIKSNWSIHTSGIKTKSRAFGITNAINSSRTSASMISLRRKEYFDFIMELDILITQKGIAGVAFRILDLFNYYAFVIDVLRGTKSIIKVVNGVQTVLTSISDGGILMNDWHKIIVTVKTADIQVMIYDTEQAQSNTEKILKAYDYTFVKGTVGVFVNKLSGFYFEGLNVNPMTCWSPWVPRSDIKINISNTNYYNESFTGSFVTKFEVIDVNNSSNLTSAWGLKNDNKLNIYGLEQKSLACDDSSARKPFIALIKDKTITNGIISTKFRPYRSEGVISIVFKYNRKYINGQNVENYYTLDLINSDKLGQWSLRKFLNGEPTEIKSVNKKVQDLKHIGYAPEFINYIVIESINDIISIKAGQEKSPLYEIMTVQDNSIQSGGIGFGSCKTEVIFTSIELLPPRIKLTDTDKTHIMSTDMNKIPIPSVIFIKKTAITANFNFSYIKRSSALSAINSMTSFTKSSMGLNFTSKSSISSSSSSSMSKFSLEIVGWQMCMDARNISDRDKLCERIYDNEIKRTTCKNDFCNSCCDNTISHTNINTLYRCKKVCSRATVSEDINVDYLKTCIQTTQPETNVYAYCDKRYNKDEHSMLQTCKLDMCNLCCVTMDPIRKKRYSWENIRKCFDECSTKFNK